MKLRSITSLIAVLSLAVLVACGGGGGGGSSDGGTTGGDTTGGGTTITSSSEGTEAASSSTQASSMSSGSTETLSQLGQFGLSGVVGKPRFPKSSTNEKGIGIASRLSGKLANSKASAVAANKLKALKGGRVSAAAATTDACTDGGSFTADFTESGTSFTGTFTFVNCREDGSQYNGTMTMTGTFDITGNGTSTQAIGNATTPFTIMEFENSYSTLVSKMETALDMSMTTSGISATGGSYAMTANGTMDVTDYLGLETYDMTFTNLKDEYTFTASSFTYKTNGAFSESWTEDDGAHSVAMTFTDFVLTTTEGTTTSTETIDGTVSIDFTPDECFEGTMTFDTTEPLVVNNSTGEYTDGTLVINGNTTVVFNPDGSVTVTVAGQTPTTYDSIYDLEQVCDFQTFEEEAPPAEGTGGGSATGSAMTVTLAWTNPSGADSTSDMDLHMNFYNTTTPTATTTGTWYVDWHQSSCTSPIDSSEYWDGVDLNGDGVCEAGLDIDDTDGFGPEHITTTTLPAGYYVISVNSYDLDTDPSVAISVTIQIGDKVFGPYTSTFTTDDGEGQTAAAWFRVADVVVTSTGGVTVTAPNANLQPWHDGAFGVFKPAGKKK